MLYLVLDDGRYLTFISHSGIWFDIIRQDAISFSSLNEVNEFKKRWKNHFFDVSKLGIIEVIKR